MEAAEFDRFAEEYLSRHAENIKLSGERPEYFARYKTLEVRRRWFQLGIEPPKTILDFGAGIGNSWPFLTEMFPQSTLTALDVSAKSLAVAESRFPGLANAVCYDGREIPLPDGYFDLIYSACVFHHIDATEHVGLFARLRRLLRPNGLMVIFEHNPLNPVTRYIVATCPFDENAVLIPSRVLMRRQREAGFAKVQVTYTGFFPGPLAALRPMERLMAALPLGAQYYTLAHAS